MTDSGGSDGPPPDRAEGSGFLTDEVVAQVYDMLHGLAVRHMGQERRDHTLQPTAVVNEAYLRLAGERFRWSSRGHFMATASTVLRKVLVDHARRHQAEKRGGGWHRLTLHDGDRVAQGPDVDLLALDAALAQLAGLDRRQARIVELRFFGGLTVDETAEVLGVRPRTVDADWHMARAWLRNKLSGEER